MQAVLVSRRMFKTQVFLFLMLCGAGRSSEMLNESLGVRWREFASQNYFDPRGVFMSIMFAGPIVLIVLVQVVSDCVFMVMQSLLVRVLGSVVLHSR